jgi:hypothetical protein
LRLVQCGPTLRRRLAGKPPPQRMIGRVYRSGKRYLLQDHLLRCAGTARCLLRAYANPLTRTDFMHDEQVVGVVDNSRTRYEDDAVSDSQDILHSPPGNHFFEQLLWVVDI